MLVLLVLLSSNREADTRVSVFPVAVTKERGEAVLAVFSKLETRIDTSASWKAFLSGTRHQ